MKRKQFLKNIFAGIIATALFQNELSAQNSVKNTGIKITKIKPYVFSNAFYVKVVTDAGISSWGEGDHESTQIIGKFIEKVLKPVLIGYDPFDSEYLWHQMIFEGFENGSTGIYPEAVAGIDNALWNLKGRILKKPVSKLLGNNMLKKKAVYGSYGRRKKNGFKTPEEMAFEGMKFVEQGNKTIKARMQV